MLAEDLQDVRQKPDPRSEQDQPDQIEPVGALAAVVGEVAVDEIETQEADRQVDEEHHPPMQVPDDETTGQGPQERADQSRYGDEGHGADELRSGEGPHNRQ